MYIRHCLVFTLFIFSTMTQSACSGDDDNSQNTNPSNLEVIVNVSDDGSGNVEIIASAQNAVEYLIDVGDASSEPVTNVTGQLTYQYANSGTYLINVRAIGVSGRYISKTKEITVQVGEEVVIDLTKGYITPDSYTDYLLAWKDEFEGTALSSDWTHEIGTGSNGWGNNELQYYRSQNTSVADDVLIIQAKNESFGGRQYTSSRIITKGNQSFKYGRIDIRAILPYGQGIWPALWMLGSNFSTMGWPKCGEIDIMEMIGGSGRENTVHGTLHWDNNGSYACTCDQSNDYSLSSGTFSDEFHVFSIIWDNQKIEWYVDDNLYKTVDISPTDLSEFQENFFFIFNVAVGGNWPGSPNSSTQFPQQMVVDYVRVFQK